MPLGYTASFSTSHLRPYTGPQGIVGATIYGTGGVRGPRGNQGPVGLSGPSGPTGMKLIGTYLQTDPEKPAYNYYILEFGDWLGSYVTAAPRGLTGTHAPVIGSTGYFYNTQDCDAPVLDDLQAPCGFTGILSGITFVSPTFRPWGGHGGASGATLSFRSIGVSGDLAIYKSGNIGPGVTYDVLGISGPDGAVQYGTVVLDGTGGVAYLSDKKNVKDSYGLTFNHNSNFSEWGTVDVNFHNISEHFYIHGNAIDGVVKDPFVIDLKEGYGNVHQIFAPFSLSGISAEFHPSKNPIVSGPSWTAPDVGATAEFGEAISITMIIDGGPFGIEFPSNFYFSDDIRFTKGRDIVNCLSYDQCTSWFCTMSGVGFGAEVTEYTLGACCDGQGADCYDYILKSDCDMYGGEWYWSSETLCSNTECGKVTDIGSCCINVDGYDNTTCIDSNVSTDISKSGCEMFGGNWRPGIPCGGAYTCGPPCGGEETGACCRFDDNQIFTVCINDMTHFDCTNVQEGTGVYRGDGTICEFLNCESIPFGACCLGVDNCQSPVSSLACHDQGGGFYLGLDCFEDNVECGCVEGFKSIIEDEDIDVERINSSNAFKISGTVIKNNKHTVVYNLYEYMVQNGVDSVVTFVPDGSDFDNISTISICLGNNLLGKSCITLSVPEGTEKRVADSFGGVGYLGKSCKEINCVERHGINLIHNDTSVDLNLTSDGKCKLKDGTIINGCDKNYCKNALGGIWKSNNIKLNQKWNITSGGQYRKD